MKKLTLLALLALSSVGFAAQGVEEVSLGQDLVSVHDGVNCNGEMDYVGEGSSRDLIQGTTAVSE